MAGLRCDLLWCDTILQCNVMPFSIVVIDFHLYVNSML